MKYQQSEAESRIQASFECQLCFNYGIQLQQTSCEACQQTQNSSFAEPQSYQEYPIEYNSRFQDESSHILDRFQQQQLQQDYQDFKPFSTNQNQLEINQNSQFDDQNFLIFQQDISVQFTNNQYEQEEYFSQNYVSTQFQNIPQNLNSSSTQPSSLKSSLSSSQKTQKSEEGFSPSSKHSQKSNKANKSEFNSKQKSLNKEIHSNSSLKSKNQSVIKNNIRDFLTPIIRMKNGFVDYDILEKENLSSFEYQNFLINNFCIPGRRSLKIRQLTFDSMFDPSVKTQLKEKKVLALISLKLFQKQFMKLILERRCQFDNHQFQLQFDWINNINETLVFFLNSINN